MKKAFFVALVSGFSVAFALQGGPSQPDYTQFEPSGVQDMVSLLTGDFTYQIPLGDVPSPYGNYPLSLSYHAGISPQQEASWVGLGWSLNPGVINRTVRGVPDDQFHGGTLGFIYQYAFKRTWTLSLGWSYGAFSVGQTFSSDGSVGYSATVGAKINENAKIGFTVGTNEVGLEATLGFKNSYALNARMMYSSRGGSQNFLVGAGVQTRGAEFSAQYSTGAGASANVGFGNGLASMGLSVSSNGVQQTTSALGSSVTRGSNGVGISVGATNLSISNSKTRGRNKSTSKGFSIFIPTQIGTFSLGYNQTDYEYWVRSSTSEYLYGYMYQAGPAIDTEKENKAVGIPFVYKSSYLNYGEKGRGLSWEVTQKGKTLEALGEDDLFPAYDLYDVRSEGVSGTFRPYARENHALYKKISDKNASDGNVESYSTILTEDSPNNNEFVLDNDEKMVLNDDYADYKKCKELSGKPCSAYGMYKTYYRNDGNRLVYNSRENEFEERSGIRFLFAGESNGFYESEDVGMGKNRSINEVSNSLLKRTIKDNLQKDYDYALYGAKKIKPIFEENNPTGRLEGFIVINSDGSRYYFKQPVRSFIKVDYSINQPRGIPVFVDKFNSSSSMLSGFAQSLKSFIGWMKRHANPTGKDFLKDLKDFFKGELKESCPSDYMSLHNYVYSYAVNMNPYATQWLLSEIQGADYVDLGGENKVGYNVKFNYSKPSLYNWRTPYARPNLPADELPNFKGLRDGFTPEGCDSKMYQASFGVKENVYLESIETSTHKAVFKLNTKERVDGKGWEIEKSEMPILTQSALSFKVENTTIKNDNTVEGNVMPQYIYFNTELPPEIVSRLTKEKNAFTLNNFTGEVKFYDDHCYARFYVEDDVKGYSELSLVADSENIEPCTTDADLKHGMYKLAVKLAKPYAIDFHTYDGMKKSCIDFLNSKENFIAGENTENLKNGFQASMYVDWGSLIFVRNNDDDESKFDNQMRYLEKISFFKKGENSPYKEYSFDYDYSLQPRTLNSYCAKTPTTYGSFVRGYPESMDEIMSSVDSIPTGVCDHTTSRSLYGKLTLRSVREIGCQNSRCVSLPPFRFDYYSKSATSTRVGDRDEWIDNMVMFDHYDEEDFDQFTDIDASIIASTNSIDEYGFWSQNGNSENHKVDQSFADFGATAWSLSKVVEPAGGVLEVEYERDHYGNSESYGDDYKNIEIKDFNKCSEYLKTYDEEKYSFNIDEKWNDKLCVRIGQLYWKDQCLGPRQAFWDVEKPSDDYDGDGFEYLDVMGFSPKNRMYYNLKSGVNTKVKCGLFGKWKCNRRRSVGVMGDGIIETIIDDERVIASNDKDKRKWKLIVFDRDYEDDISAGLKKAAQKISQTQVWKPNPFSSGSFGSMWAVQELDELKGGDLRVTRLSHHDVNTNSQTVYEYGVGELSQLADSSYTTVLGNRFNSVKASYALPDVNMKPKSRIVGFNDDDLMFIPGSRVTYPKVSVFNTSNDGKNSKNGRTEFKYVTPETGIPSEFIDEETKKNLIPFIKFDVRLVKHKNVPEKITINKGKDDEREVYVAPSRTQNQGLGWWDVGDYGRMFEFELLDEKSDLIGRKIQKTLYEDDISHVYFYAENMRNASKLRVTEIVVSKNQTGEYQIEKGIPYEMQLLHKDEKLTSFNEMMIAIRCLYVKEQPKVTRSWFRSQKEGFYPVVYKKIKTVRKNMWRPSLKDLTNVFGLLSENDDEGTFVEHDVDDAVEYHDFTSFIGLNYNITMYRGAKDSEIVVQSDSTIYSTKAPDILEGVVSQSEYALSKVGQHREHWTTTSKLDCKDGLLMASKCLTDNPSLRRIENNTIEKAFSHIRYPVFFVGSVSHVGNDNQSKENAESYKKLSKSKISYHRFDPMTGAPTATVATINAIPKNGSSREIRKITMTTPHYALRSNEMADSMLLRNMLTQQYLEELYFDTVEVYKDWNSVLYSDEQKTDRDYSRLRSYSISPYKFLKDKKSIVAWGTFTSRKIPSSIRPQALEFANADKVPYSEDYSGNFIKTVNEKYKVVEIADVNPTENEPAKNLVRTTSMVYSDNGLNQIGIFYPAEKQQNAVIVPNGNDVSFNNCGLVGNEEKKNFYNIENGSIVATAQVSFTCTIERKCCLTEDVLATEDSIVVESRKWNEADGWKVYRDVKTFTGKNYSYNLSLNQGERLNYLRIYPKNSESKIYVYDSYGNMIQIVTEDNTSLFYEYDSFGKLKQVRNDDGVSFKAHHREFMNSNEF